MPKPELFEWLREVKRIALERYEFTKCKADAMFSADKMEDYYWDGLTPEAALEKELTNGE